MSKGFSKLDDPSHEGKTNTWLTPLWLISCLGEFDLDPCGHQGHQTARRIITLPEDGLKAKWEGRVWLNPPYGSQIGHWLRKLEEHGNGIALVFGRTDTNWFHDRKPDLFFAIKGRLKFLKEDFTESTNAGHGNLLLAFGRENAGAILMASRIKGKVIK